MFKKWELKFDEILSDKPEVIKLVNKLRLERPYAKIAGRTSSEAHAALNSFIEDSSDTFIPIIRNYESEIDDILKMDRVIKRNTDETSLNDATAAATIDTQLTKENDTPDGGNIDLIDDTFLSHSTRTNVNTGVREKMSLDERVLNEDLVEVNNIDRLKLLPLLKDLVEGTYTQWLELIDLKYITFEAIDM